MKDEYVVAELVKGITEPLNFAHEHRGLVREDPMRDQVLSHLVAAPGVAGQGRRISDAAITLVLETVVAKLRAQDEEIRALRWRLDHPELYDQLRATEEDARDAMRRLAVPDELSERYARSLTGGSDEEVEQAFAGVLQSVLDRLPGE